MEPRTRHWKRLPRPPRTDDLYDLAYGPPPPASRHRVAGEWDDPTWLAADVDEERLAALIDQDEQVARWEERRAREKKLLTGTYGPRPTRRPADAVLDAVLDVLAAGPATAAHVQSAGALTPKRTTRALRWLAGLGDVRSDRHPDTGQVFWRLATTEADAVWANRMAQTRAETDRRNREAAQAAGHGSACRPERATRRSAATPVEHRTPQPTPRPLFPRDRTVLKVLGGDVLTVEQLAARAALEGVPGLAVPVVLRGLVGRGLVAQIGDDHSTRWGHDRGPLFRAVTDSG